MKSAGKNIKKSDSGLTTLRSYAKWRILHDMIENVRKHARFSKDYLIMILDDSALKVFSSTCKFFDLFLANLFQVERLALKRKRFPKSDAIYFISPTAQSVKRLIEDFQNEKDNAKPQYGGVHLCFTSHLSDELMKDLANCKQLAPRLLSFNEINIDFYLFNDNVFHFSKKNLLPMFKLCDDEGIDHPLIEAVLNELAHRLFTVCAIFIEFPYIQYQGSSELAKALAEKVNNNLKQFYQRLSNIKIREPRGTLLILDRGFDLIAPVIHDFYYQSLIYELRDVGDDGEIVIDNKTVFINDQDQLWVRFRNKHIADVHIKLNEEVSKIANEAKKTKKTEEMNLQEMAEVIRQMPKYKEMMMKYNVHIDLANKTIMTFTKNNLRKLINLEQDIISGVDVKGVKINNTNIVKEMSQISKDLTQIDYLRLIMQYFACYDLSPKDKETMLKSIRSDAHRIILQNMEYLDPTIAQSKKFRRKKEEMTPEEFNEYARRASQSDYEITRCQPNICRLIKKVHENQLDAKEFPFIDKVRQNVQKTNNVKKKGARVVGTEFDKQDILENGRIFTFVIGGLSHHEIVSIATLQETMNAQIIPGSNTIMSTKQYLEWLERLHRKDSEQVLKQMSMNDNQEDTDDNRTIDDDNDDESEDNGYLINNV